ncbi:hypothetical protein E8E11_002366 [Didymella keratinophila]|nr:hypothetical protein E8E11_002366 [Didymella keratinophila]
MITIVVRDNNKTKGYKVFRKLLMWHSSYFTRALNPSSRFISEQEKSITLEYSHQLSNAFYCWLYTGRLKDPVENAAGKTQVYLDPALVCEILLLAYCRGIPELGNSAIDMLHECYVATWNTPNTCITYIHSNTVAIFLLRSFIVYWSSSTHSFESLDFPDEENQQTVQYLHDVMLKIAERNGQRHWSREEAMAMNRCQWHDDSGPGGKPSLESRK